MKRWFLARLHNAAARPACGAGPESRPGLPHRHGFSPGINGVDASRPCVGRSLSQAGLVSLPACTIEGLAGVIQLAGIPATVGLPFDNLLGQMDQHPLCPMIPQFVKSSQQAQSEK